MLSRGHSITEARRPRKHANGEGLLYCNNTKMYTVNTTNSIQQNVSLVGLGVAEALYIGLHCTDGVPLRGCDVKP